MRGFLCGGFGGFFEVVGDFDDAWGVCGEGGDVFGYVFPFDGAGAGPEVVVFLPLIVVEVEFGDAWL